jgi:hypothetical protein
VNKIYFVTQEGFAKVMPTRMNKQFTEINEKKVAKTTIFVPL